MAFNEYKIDKHSIGSFGEFIYREFAMLCKIHEANLGLGTAETDIDSRFK